MKTAVDTMSALREARQITREMLDMAEKGSWSKLPEHQRRRQEIFEQVFEQPNRVMDIPGMARLIQDILEINSQLVSVSQRGRSEAREQISQVRRGRSGVGAYSKVAVG